MSSSKVIDQAGQTQVWKAHYFRHHSEYWDDFDSPEDALSYLEWGREEGALSAVGVVWPDGIERKVRW